MLESLEPRRLLAGTVAVSYDAATNTVIIHGDNQANQVRVDGRPFDGTTLFAITGDGTNIVSTVPNTESIPGGVRFLPPVEVPPALSIDLGNGDDTLTVGGEFDRTNMTIDTGNGDDSVTTFAEFNNSTVNLTTGNGNDSVDISERIISTDLNIATGNGDDQLNLHNLLLVQSTPNIDTGRGDDQVTLAGVSQSQGAASINTSQGDDTVTITDWQLRNATLTIDGGSGFDTLTGVANVTAGASTFSTSGFESVS